MKPKTPEEERTELIQRINDLSESQWAWFVAEARKVIAAELEKEDGERESGRFIAL